MALPHLRDYGAQGPDPVFAPDGGGEGQALTDAPAYGKCMFVRWREGGGGEVGAREGERDCSMGARGR